MEDIKREYYATLPAQFEALRKAWGATALEKIPGENFEHFYRLVHSLAGKSDTFGMTETGARARSLERVLNDFHEKARMPNEREREAVAGWLEQIINVSGKFVAKS